MLELFCNLQTKTVSKSAGSIAEFVLPPFYLGETRKVRIHTFIPSSDPLAPTEIQSVETDVALQAESNTGAIIINSLSQVSGQSYREGVLVIPSNAVLAGSGTAFLTLSIRVTTGTDVVTFEKPATLQSQVVDFGVPILPAGNILPAVQSVQVFQSLTGQSASLETISTVGIVNTAYMVNESGAIHIWNLVAGSAATNLTNGILRPLDYNGSTNAKNFIRAD